MKTLKVEAVYLMDYQTFEDVTDWRTLMSALPPIADIAAGQIDVRFVPSDRIARLSKIQRKLSSYGTAR
jgi:hypothetical protein